LGGSKKNSLVALNFGAKVWNAESLILKKKLHTRINNKNENKKKHET